MIMNKVEMETHKDEGIATPHPELKKAMPAYEIIRDCIEGELKIKSLQCREKYFPKPPMTVKNMYEVELGYERYVNRAQFQEHLNQRIETVVGLAFTEEPTVVVPPELEPMIENINKQGLGIVQFAKQVFGHVYAFGRASLLTEFPFVLGSANVSRADLMQGTISPCITMLKAWELLSWSGYPTVNRVVAKQQMAELDEYSIVYCNTIKVYHDWGNGIVYSLWKEDDNGMYQPVELRSRDENGEELNDYQKTHETLTTANGTPLMTLPVIPIGSDNNDFAIDRAPGYRIASASLSQARSSADYEDSAAILGGPSLIIKGINENNMYEYTDDGRIDVGPKGIIRVPPNGDASILQAQPNQPAHMLVMDKQAQIDKLTATAADDPNVNKTAAAANIDNVIRNAGMKSIAMNVSTAITEALRIAYSFVSSRVPTEDELKFEIKVNDNLTKYAPPTLAELIQLRNENGITESEFREHLVDRGIADPDNTPEILANTAFPAMPDEDMDMSDNMNMSEDVNVPMSNS